MLAEILNFQGAKPCLGVGSFSNKHIKVVTRDRASAYAKVISEELPDAMQVADRFHLHQNLLEAIKKALNHTFPATVSITHVEQSTVIEEPCKKNQI